MFALHEALEAHAMALGSAFDDVDSYNSAVSKIFEYSCSCERNRSFRHLHLARLLLLVSGWSADLGQPSS